MILIALCYRDYDYDYDYDAHYDKDCKYQFPFYPFTTQ